MLFSDILSTCQRWQPGHRAINWLCISPRTIISTDLRQKFGELYICWCVGKSLLTIQPRIRTLEAIRWLSSSCDMTQEFCRLVAYRWTWCRSRISSWPQRFTAATENSEDACFNEARIDSRFNLQLPSRKTDLRGALLRMQFRLGFSV